jgi:hypothetical protein
MPGDGYVTIRKVKKEVNQNNYSEHIFFTQTFPKRETANGKRKSPILKPDNSFWHYILELKSL